MRLKLRALALVLCLCALAFAGSAKAQGYIRVTTCGDARPPAGAGTGYMDANGQICVAATASATTTATASAAPTPVLAGSGKPLNIDLFSSLFSQPTFAGTQVDLTHGLPVNVVAGSAGGTALADEAAYNVGSTAFTPMGGFFQNTATNGALTNGQGGWAQMTSNRALHMNLRTAAGVETGIAAAPLQVSLANTGANGTKLLVTPDLPTGASTSANQATEIASLATIATNTGAAVPAGTAVIGKVGIDQTTPGTTNLVALAANQSVNEAQINGVTPLMGNGASGTGAQRVAIASDSSARAVAGEGATGSAPPSGAQYGGYLGSGATGGLLAGAIVCDKYVFKHITSATDTLAVQGVASQQIRICGVESRAAGAATWFLENTASVNANCSSTLTQIAILNTEAANTGMVSRSPLWSGLSNTSGNGLCINSTGTGGIDVGIYYAQF